MFNWKQTSKKKRDEEKKKVSAKKSESSEKNVAKAISRTVDRDQLAYDTWKEDKERRNKGFIPNSKEGASFKEASRGIQYNSKIYANRERNSSGKKWRKEIADQLGKGAGRKFDDRIKNALKQNHGMSEAETENFMKYMDAKELDAELGGKEYARLEETKAREDFKVNDEKQINLAIQASMRESAKIQSNKSKVSTAPSEKPQDEDRGFLDRTFDALLGGQYISANTAKALIDGKGGYTVKGAVRDGLRAANPTGKGYEAGEGNYSDVVKLLESKYGNETTAKVRETSLGKFSIGAMGFIGDVLLDPTTYATFGIGAVAKGAGRIGSVGKSLSKNLTKQYGVKSIKSSDEIAAISDDLYKKVREKTANEMQGHATQLIDSTARATTDNLVQSLKLGFDGLDVATAKGIVGKQASKGGVTRTAEQITKDAETLTRKYNQLLGYTRQGKIGLSLGNMPFAEKVFGKNLASKTLGFSDATVRKISDKLALSAPYTKLRNGLYSMKAVSHLSPTSVMFKMAKESPEKLYQIVNLSEATRALKGGAIASEKAVREFSKVLSDLSPSQQKEVREIMQDASKWQPIVKQLRLAETVEGKAFASALEATKVEEYQKLSNLRDVRKSIDEMRSYQDNDLFDMKTQLDVIEKDYAEQIKDIDLELFKGTSAYDEALDIINAERKKLEDEFMNVSSDLLKQVELPALPRKPVMKEMKREKPVEPELASKPAEPKLEAIPEQGSFHRHADTDQRDYIFNNWVEYKGLAYGTQHKREFIDNLNQFLGNDVKIAKMTYDYEIDRIVKQIEEGVSKQEIASYVNANKYRFDGRAPEIYSLVAERVGYGSGTKFRNWDEYYTKRIADIDSKRGTEKFTPGLQRLYDKLNKDALYRSQLIVELKGKSMQQILRRKKEMLDADLMKLHDTEADRMFSEVATRTIGRDPMPNNVMDEGRGIERVGTSSGQSVAYQATKSGGNRAVDVGVGNGGKLEEVYNFKLISSEVEEVKAFVFKTASKLNSNDILKQGGIAGFANKVATEAENVLASTFKREWSNLTPKQRSFAVTLASKNVIEGSPDLAKSAEIKKFAKHIEERMVQRHAEAVNGASKIGDKVLMRESELAGTIENKQYYPDGLVEYDVRYADGTVETVTTDAIKEINSAKPADILFSQIVKDSIDESYMKAVKEIEERNQKKLSEYAQTVKQIDDENAKAMESYQKRLEEWQAKREADYAAAMEKYNREHPAILEERRRIKALNEATREQYEQAIRESSKLADEFFERSAQLEELISASKEVSATNMTRKVAVEQIGRVRESNKTGLLDSMKEVEKQSDKIAKYLSGEGQLENMVKSIDEQIKKVDDDLAKLRQQEPVDMEDLIQREDNLFRQIQERQKKVKVDRYSGEGLNPRLNNALPNKVGKLERTPDELKVLDEIKDLEKRMKDVQAEIGVARTSMLKENWNEEMSRLISTKSHLEGERALYDGSTDIVKMMDDLEKNVHEIDRILGNDDLLDAYIKERVAPEQIQKWYEDFNNNRVLDEVSFETGNQYSQHVIDIAKQLRKNFISMGMKEVEIGRMKAGAFDEMLDHYLPHVLSPAGRKFMRSKEGRNVSAQGGLPFGFYNTDNPFAKARTLKTITFEDGTVVNNPTIEQANRYFKEKHGVEEFFQTSLPDIYLSRALKHNELVYSDDYMENIMSMFGTRVTRDNVDEFDSFQVNVGQLRDYVQSKVSQQISYAQSSGILRPSQNFTEDMLEAVRNDIMRDLHIDPRVIKEDIVPMLSLNKKQTKALLDEGQDWVHSVPKEIVMKANQARMISIERDHNRMLKFYDKFLHWVKLMQTVVSPSFHMRNKMGNMFNSWLSVGGRVNSPAYQKKMFQVIHHKGEYSKLRDLEPMIVNKPDGTQELMAWSNVYDTARKYGVIDEGYFAQEFGAQVAQSTAKGKMNLKPWDSQNFAPIRVGTKAGWYNENMDRLAQFSAHLADGKTADEAKELVDKYLFDYSDLTMFEQRVMKRIFPYYTFWRKNTSLQLRSISEHSQKLALTAKVMNAPEGMLEEEDKVERKYVSDFAKSWIQLPMWSKGVNAFTGEEEREPVLLNPALPFMELDRIPNPFEIDEAFMGTMAMTAPLIKNPFELATNKSTFFNSPISQKVKYEDENGDTQFKTDWGKLAKDYGKHVLMQTAPAVQAEGAISKKGTDLALHALNFFTGVKALSYNYGISKSIAQNKEAYEGGYMKEWQRDSYEKYQESRRVPFDKVLDFARENLNLVEQHGKLSEKYYVEAGKLAGTLDRWTKGETLTSEDAKYQPFIDVMERVGKKFGKDENQTRDFIGATLDKSGLDGIVLGKDFTTLKVDDVLDGDTFTVDYKGKKRSVRLLLVDTPETSKRPGQPDMAYGKEAFKFTSDMIKGRDVEMVIDNRGTDHYGRLLSYVYIDGKLLQGQLVSEGYANLAYTDMEDSSRNNYREDLLRTLRDKAKGNKKGVHSIDGYARHNGSYDNASYMTEEELKRYYGK